MNISKTVRDPIQRGKILPHVPPSYRKIYIPLSLVHIISTVVDNGMHQNA